MIYGLKINIPDTHYLDSSARLRRMSRKMLLEILIETILKDQLILPILDDEEERVKPTRKTRIVGATRVERVIGT